MTDYCKRDWKWIQRYDGYTITGDSHQNYYWNFILLFVDVWCASVCVFDYMHLDQNYAPGVLPYMGYIGICGAKGYGFLAVLVWNRVSILTILVWNRAWFVNSSLELVRIMQPALYFVQFCILLNKSV